SLTSHSSSLPSRPSAHRRQPTHPTHAFHGATHLPQQALAATLAELGHHLFHLHVLLQYPIDIGRLGARTAGHAGPARAVQQVRVTALFPGHRIDDGDHLVHFAVIDLRLDAV